jgi:hypothetical protein
MNPCSRVNHPLDLWHLKVLEPNKDGSFLKAMVRQLPSVASALVAKAEAWRDGLWLLGPSPHQRVILETNSLELITIWRSRESRR